MVVGEPIYFAGYFLAVLAMPAANIHYKVGHQHTDQGRLNHQSGLHHLSSQSTVIPVASVPNVLRVLYATSSASIAATMR